MPWAEYFAILLKKEWMVQAVMVVADAEISLTITGNGDVLEPYDGVIGEGTLSLVPRCDCILFLFTAGLWRKSKKHFGTIIVKVNAGIGSGGSYASAAARALIDLPDMDAETIGECPPFVKFLLATVALRMHRNLINSGSQTLDIFAGYIS